MKTKKLSKKLTLNKATISNLNDDQLNQAKGGEIWTEGYCTETCNTAVTLCDCPTWPKCTLQIWCTTPLHTCTGEFC
jgi:natural product precursor